MFATADEAAHIAAALAPENDGYVTVEQNGATLIARASGETPLSLLHTLDDVLACADAAKKAAALATRGD